MNVRMLVVVVLAAMAAGCTSFQAMAPTPGEIVAGVAAGDRVRVRERGSGEPTTLVVWGVGREGLSGREPGAGGAPRLVPFDRIEAIEVERADLRRTLLSTVVPVILGAVAVCQRQQCRTRAVIIAEM